MKFAFKVVLALVAVFLFGVQEDANAVGYFGQRTPARVLTRGDLDVAGYFGIFQDAMAVFGEARTGLMNNADGGIRLGVLDYDNGGGSGIILGADFKYNVLNERAGDPFELALAPELSYFSNHVSVFSLGASAIASVDLFTTGDRRFTPYGRVEVRLDNYSVDEGPSYAPPVKTQARSSGTSLIAQSGADDSEFEVAASFGATFELSDLLEIAGEFVLDNDSGVLFGLNFRL